MKRLAMAAGLVLAGSGAVLGDECVYDPSGFIYAGDDSAITASFDSFFAAVNNPGHCSLVFDAHQNVANDPDLFEVYTADYRGAVLPGPDDEAEVTVDHNGQTDVLNQTDTAGVFATHYVGKEADGTIRQNMDYKLVVATDPGSEASIDSIDYALAGTMTRADAEDSLDSIALDQVGLITHLDATTGLITGLSLEGDNEAGLFGGVGSLTMGARARYNLADGFSLLGGLSLVDQSPGAHYAGLVGVAAVRWVQPGSDGVRMFGEAGGEAGVLGLQFTRSYTDSNGDHTATGNGQGWLGAVYGKGGVVIAPDDANSIVLSATIKQSFLGISSYQEDVGADNLFAADLGGTTPSFTTAKIGAEWTTALAQDLTLTSSLAVGTTIGSAPEAYIFGGGDVVGTGASTAFVDYGLDLGWHVSPGARVDGFINGSTGTGIGTHVQVGAAYTTSF